MRKHMTFALVAALCTALTGSGATLTYTGANGGDWNTASNWDGNAVPTIGDDVVINAKWVQSATSISAKSITVTGNGSNAGLVVGGKNMTKDDVQKQVPYDATSASTITMTVADDVSFSNAHLSLGGRRSTAKCVDTIGATIGGDFALSGGAIAVFYAGETAGVDALDRETSSALLYANANVVAIGGALTVGASSYLYVENDSLTGTPVFFRSATVSVAAGGTISGSSRGWDKHVYSAAPYPVGTTQDENNSRKLCYAFGQAYTWSCGASHGGLPYTKHTNLSVRHITASDGTYETKSLTSSVYGNAEAPFLPGSPGGFQWNDHCRGGASVCVFASGAVAISGTVSSDGQNGRTPGSGGSVWLAGSSFEITPSAKISATGGDDTDGRTIASGGGRISLAAGLTPAQINALAAGTTAVSLGLAATDAYGADFNVIGGVCKDAVTYANSGTATIVYGASCLPMAIDGTPSQFSTATPAYGLHILPRASVPASFTVAEPTTSPAFYRGFRRYGHVGYVVTDSDAEPVSDIAASPKAVTVQWQWTSVEDCFRLRIAGGGTVTVNGTDYTANADLWFAPGTALSLSATDGTGAFVAFYGDIEGGKNTASPLALAATPGKTVWAVFSDATGAAKSYVGADNGFWDVDTNWSPAGVPSPLDDVTVASKQVKAYGVAVAKSLTLSAGKLAVGGASAATTTAQTAPTDAFIDICGLVVEGGFSATGASAFSIGARRPTATLTAALIGGDLSLAGTSTFSAYAEPYKGEVGQNGKIALESYSGAATLVSVGGDMTLADSAVVYSENDVKTGTAICFDVSGDVEIGASASVDATNRGWGWTKIENEGGVTDPRSRKTENGWYTLSVGYGKSWDTGGAYGGQCTSTVHGKNSGTPYGYKYAPHLPGSPCGAYSDSTATWRPGGTVWIKTPGTMTVNGAVRANSTAGYSTGGRSSAGGVWLVCGEFSGGPNASLEAKATQNVSGSVAPGTGGRISIAIGVSDADLAALAAGGEPSGLTYSDEIAIVAATVSGGHFVSGSTTYPDAPGTCTTVMGALSTYPLSFASVPAGVYADGLDYAPVSVTVGESYSVTAPAYAFAPGYPSTVRYACAGWVVSNATAEVASGSGATATFTPETGPFVLTWLWNGRENIAAIKANDADLGAVAVNGGASGATADAWIAAGAPVTVSATPAEGAEFLYWTGDVPFGKARDNPLSFAASVPRRLTAVFRVAEAPTTRLWNGGKNQQRAWLNTNYWSPKNLPGLHDNVIIATGTVDVSNRIDVASLTVYGDARIRIGGVVKTPNQPHLVCVTDVRARSDTYQVQPYAGTFLEEAGIVVVGDLVVSNQAQISVGALNNRYSATVSVGGDFRLGDTAKVAVFATATNDAFTVASGTSWVDVGGTLAVEGAAILYARCEQFSGAGVVIRPKNLHVAAGARIDSCGAGFSWTGSRLPSSDAPSSSHGDGGHPTAGGHGGRGSGWDYTLASSWGRTYGNEYAPTLPGTFGSFYSSDYTGGGLLRIHAARAVIEGTLNASAYDYAHYSGGAGGAIWLTASKSLVIAPAATLAAHGGRSNHSGGGLGGGGRIALGLKLTDAQIAELAATGTLEKIEKKDVTAAWRADNPSVTIDLAPGKKYDGGNPPDETARPELYGTFRVLDGRALATMIILE